MRTFEAAHGRWREILPALGIPPQILDGNDRPCPLCGGKDRFRFDDKHGDGDYFCRGCKPGKGIKLLQGFHGWDFARAAREVDQIIGNLPPSRQRTKAPPEDMCGLYHQSLPVAADNEVGSYLANRCIPGPYPKALRYVPAMMHWPTRTKHPGMLAVFYDVNGKATTMQRTYLTEDGRKADVERPRVNMHGRTLPSGGAIRLGPIAETMGIAEGVETALSAFVLFGVPVWATTSAVLLERWQPPPEVKRVVVYSDADFNFVGQAAAYKLAARLVFEAKRDKIEREVGVMVPPLGKDWNDVLMERARDRAAGVV